MILAATALMVAALACSPQVPDTGLVISSDPDLKARVSVLLPELADRAGMELVRPVRVERRTREQLESYLLFKVDQDFPPERARNLSRTYSLVGLVPEGLDLRELLISVYMEQVAGFYDPDSTALFVMDDMPPDDVEGVLIHELVHAVQDQTANLDSLTAQGRGNDRQAAAQSAIEGHATVVMMEYALEQVRGQPVDFTEIPDISQMVAPALEAMRDQYPALTSAPTIVQEALLFPYLKGFSFVSAFWNMREGRPPPFGPNLPQSTEQIMDPERAFGSQADVPTELGLGPMEGYEVAYSNVFGQAELSVLLNEHLGEGGQNLAQGWDGDRYALVRGENGSEGLVWASVWDSSEQRDRFVSGFQSGLPEMGGPATLEAVEVLGRPGALLRVGIPQDVGVQVVEGTTGSTMDGPRG